MIAEKVDKLSQMGFIKEMTYPKWIVNIVIMKKVNENDEFASTSST